MMQISSAGKRGQRINILKPINAADGYGGLETQYADLGAFWVQIMPPKYQEQQAQGAPMSRESITVKLQPAYMDLKRGWRILWQDEAYNVESVDNTYRERTLFVMQRLEPGE